MGPEQEELEKLRLLMENLRHMTGPEERGRAEYLLLKKAREISLHLQQGLQSKDPPVSHVEVDATLLEIEERLSEIEITSKKAENGAKTLVLQALDSFKLAAGGWHSDIILESLEIHQETLSTLERNRGWLTVPLDPSLSELRRWERNAAILSSQMAILSDAETHGRPTSYSVAKCANDLSSVLEQMERSNLSTGFLMAYAIDVESLLGLLIDNMGFLTDQDFSKTFRDTIRRLERSFQNKGGQPPAFIPMLQRLTHLESQTGLAQRIVKTVSRQPAGMQEQALLGLMTGHEESILKTVLALVQEGFLRRKPVKEVYLLQVAKHKVPGWWTRENLGP